MSESLFNKVAGLRARNFNKKRLRHVCFPVKFTKFLRTTPVATSELYHLNNYPKLYNSAAKENLRDWKYFYKTLCKSGFKSFP